MLNRGYNFLYRGEPSFEPKQQVQQDSVFVWYTRSMQKIATRIFVCASITFGIVGIVLVLTASGPDKPDSTLSMVLIRLLFVTVFIILPSFALSVAGKYLSDKA